MGGCASGGERGQLEIVVGKLRGEILLNDLWLRRTSHRGTKYRGRRSPSAAGFRRGARFTGNCLCPRAAPASSCASTAIYGGCAQRPEHQAKREAQNHRQNPPMANGSVCSANRLFPFMEFSCRIEISRACPKLSCHFCYLVAFSFSFRFFFRRLGGAERGAGFGVNGWSKRIKRGGACLRAHGLSSSSDASRATHRGIGWRP